MDAAEKPAPRLQPAQVKALHALNKDFCGALPQEVRNSNRYDVVAGDRFVRQRVAVPDGLYRVAGSEFVFAIAAARMVSAVRAVPPDFGGSGVIHVEFEAPGINRPTTEK